MPAAAATSPARILVRLSLAGVKRLRATVRGARGDDFAGWALRAEACARCPLSVVRCGKSYCGRPLLNQLDRDEATQGCGCPVGLKARDPAEHCPRTARFAPASKLDAGRCDCVWCVAARADAAARDVAAGAGV